MNDRPTDRFDLDQLLHPARAFKHPSEVVNDADLTLNEKRAILASWASDACAIEAAPDLRSPSGGALVRFDDIMEALRTLDESATGTVIAACCVAGVCYGARARMARATAPQSNSLISCGFEWST